MSTKYTKPDVAPTSTNPVARANIPEDFELPPCGIEDIDRAVFKLFDEELPLYFTRKGNTEKIPVIFATGERAFILRRNKPLTDKSGALILPLVSVMRSGLDHEATANGFGVGPGDGNLIIAKRKHKESIDFFNRTNAEGLQNQNNIVNEKKHIGPSIRGYRNNTRIPMVENAPLAPVTEIISMPSPRYFSATYDITFWAQYLQQMNGMLEAVMSSYTHNQSRSFKIETDKGYWFVAYVDSGLTGDLNFDSMTDAERIVKYNFSISVNGYIINPKFPGSQTLLRRTLSAPEISFDTSTTNSAASFVVGVPSGYPEDYTNTDLESFDDPLPGAGIGGVKIPAVGPTSAGKFAGDVDINGGASVNIGGRKAESNSGGTFGGAGANEFVRLEAYLDPFTGEIVYRRVLVKSKRSRHGETVHSMLSIED
tara:strand:- start:3627 stop:4901 length:1275 start_codon:yes stop_codon:yes gene_type:complete